MALILFVSFISFAIILRILIQYYYIGNHGVRFASLKAPYIETVPGTIFVLTFIISGALILMNNFGVFAVYASLPLVVSIVSGLIGFAGITITVIAQIQMGRSWRIGVAQNEKTDLIVDGLYSKSRNPIYFGILLYWLAVVISFPHPVMWICASVCWICIELIVRKVEEPYLRRVHGHAFADYCRGSNRYLIW